MWHDASIATVRSTTPLTMEILCTHSLYATLYIQKHACTFRNTRELSPIFTQLSRSYYSPSNSYLFCAQCQYQSYTTFLRYTFTSHILLWYLHLAASSSCPLITFLLPAMWTYILTYSSLREMRRDGYIHKIKKRIETMVTVHYEQVNQLYHGYEEKM